jgi:Fe-S-cluster containining protein
MTKRSPWYKDGLNFTCTQCGNCCTGAPGVVWVTDEEIAQIAALRGMTIEEVRRLHTRLIDERVSLTEHKNGDCTFFDADTRRCTVYGARPSQCRTWPFWNSNLESREAWETMQKSCPGAGHGQFVPLEDIQRLARVIDV